MCDNELVTATLKTAFEKGAAYQWVWFWRFLDGRQEIVCKKGVGQYEAKERAEKERGIAVGYQYTSDDMEIPAKVALVFPRQWIVNYTVHRDGTIYQLYRKKQQAHGGMTEEFVEDLLGQFPECLCNIRVTDIKIGCID